MGINNTASYLELPDGRQMCDAKYRNPAPPAMGHYMAEKMPHCKAQFIKGAGHFWIFEHLAEMLETLVSEALQTETRSGGIEEL